MNIQEMFGSMGLVGLSVMVCLIGLSIYSVAVTLDKLRRFRAAARQSDLFLDTFRLCLREGKLQEMLSSARQHGRSPIACVVGAGLSELADSAQDDPTARVELVENAIDRSTSLTLADLRRGLAGLATIGSTAPFVGLFGTVVGIVHAFRGMATTGSGGMAAVSGGIAEALVATALGLLVAIPAVVAFNYFASRVERFHVDIEATATQLVDHCKKRIRVAHAAAR
jgi:biopolymer transport protein ExbB/biopolymer transport protein TolQ